MKKVFSCVMVTCLLFCFALTMASCNKGHDSIFHFEQKKDGTLTVTAFYEKHNVKYATVEIPATYMDRAVTEIGKQVFEGNAVMAEVVIPDSVTVIGDSAFANCSRLTEIDLPDGLTTIGQWAFYNCKNITSIELPLSVKTIGANAFNGMSSLTAYKGSMAHMPMMWAEHLTSVTLVATDEDYLSPAVLHLCKSLTALTYTGTVAEWEAMPKADNWFEAFPGKDLVVHCADGDLSFEKTST